jgi:ketosteroid isomerase-like protein
MRKSGFTIGTIAATLIIALSLGGQARAANAKAQIEDLEHKCASATTVDDLMACYDSNNDIVVYDLETPREFDGTKAVRGDFQNFFDNFKNPKIEFVSLHVVTDGKMGFANSIQHFTGTDKAGKPVDLTFRVTDVWHKVNGQWKMIHTHVSFPIDMASGKADMQSKP